MRVSDFDYDLPEPPIAQAAIEPRDASRLLDTTTMTDRVFRDIPELLSEGDLLVVNETKVRAARLVGRRSTGGGAEVLLLRRVDDERWEALVRPARKLASGSIVQIAPHLTVVLATDPVDGHATVRIDAERPVEEAIAEAGALPLPPYFHGSLASPDRYQTIFARIVGSAAAPTAALHFTEGVLDALEHRGVRVAVINLEVGLDTFRPMDRGVSGDADVATHRIHSEHVTVPAATVEAIERTRRIGGRVIAVGTTVVRSLETAATGGGSIREFTGETDLFITPGYRPQVVDAVVTNFHAPSTTLLVLIATLLGERWKDVYQVALERGYRFLSFGDAMWIEVDR